jgi:hydroxymethylpyrimidine pyrophosphatase-like HAD family hydrolase
LLQDCSMAHYLALAADGDGTLMTRGSMSRATLRALQQLVESGRKLILVTGERLATAVDFPHLALFHRVVAENGAILLNPAGHKQRRLCRPRPPRLLAGLQSRVPSLQPGNVVICGKISQRKAVDDALRELGSDWRTVPNRRDLLILPPGVSKATGLAAALDELKIAPRQVVGLGDAENDLPLIECCGLGVAPANAIPLIKAAAHLVTKGRAGSAAAELIERMLQNDLPAPQMGRPCATALDDGGMSYLARALRPRTSKRDVS